MKRSVVGFSSPKQQQHCLRESLEVVVPVDLRVVPQRYLTKHLKKKAEEVVTAHRMWHWKRSRGGTGKKKNKTKTDTTMLRDSAGLPFSEIETTHRWDKTTDWGVEGEERPLNTGGRKVEERKTRTLDGPRRTKTGHRPARGENDSEE